MRQYLNDTSFVAGTRTIDTSIMDLKITDLELIINATLNEILFMAIEPLSVVDVSNGKITYASSYVDGDGETVLLPVLQAGDSLKVYVDFGISGRDTYVAMTTQQIDEMMDRILVWDTSTAQN